MDEQTFYKKILKKIKSSLLKLMENREKSIEKTLNHNIMALERKVHILNLFFYCTLVEQLIILVLPFLLFLKEIMLNITAYMIFYIFSIFILIILFFCILKFFKRTLIIEKNLDTYNIIFIGMLFEPILQTILFVFVQNIYKKIDQVLLITLFLITLCLMLFQAFIYSLINRNVRKKIQKFKDSTKYIAIRKNSKVYVKINSDDNIKNIDIFTQNFIITENGKIIFGAKGIKNINEYEEYTLSNMVTLNIETPTLNNLIITDSNYKLYI